MAGSSCARCKGSGEITMSYIDDYLNEAIGILERIDRGQMEKMVQLLLTIREQRGRLFFLGVGGSAGNASHAVNDFRKIADFEAYTPADNVSELMARTNDEGWDTVFVEWLREFVRIHSVGYCHYFVSRSSKNGDHMGRHVVAATDNFPSLLRKPDLSFLEHSMVICMNSVPSPVFGRVYSGNHGYSEHMF